MLLQAGHEVVGLDTDLFERSTFSEPCRQKIAAAYDSPEASDGVKVYRPEVVTAR
jgi:hypothetical protein